MKISRLIAAAGLIVASLSVSGAADAQRPVERTRVVTTRTVHTRVVHRRPGLHRPRCTTVWRHHHRIRRCR
jgi:hypothetical protein